MHDIPQTSGDYLEVRSWFDYWRSTGASPYGAAGLAVDYLPHAFLVLWPMQWLPTQAGPELFALINVLFCVTAAWLLVRWVADLAGASLTTVEIVSIVAMLLSLRPTRDALLRGQTMALAVLLLTLALRLAPRRPFLAGLCFALASFKINLAVGFGLVMLLLDFGIALLFGVATTAVLTIGAAVALRETPAHLLAEYVRTLWSIYGGGLVPSATGIQPVLALLLPNPTTVFLASFVIGVGSLGVVVWLTARVRHRPAAAAIVATTALVWSLIALPNQVYNVALAVPALWLVSWPESPLVKDSRLRWFFVSAALVYLVPSLPFQLQEHLVPWWFAIDRDSHRWLSTLWPFLDRMLVYPLFAVCLFELWRIARPAPQTSSSP